jgi:hypothetical protein
LSLAVAAGRHFNHLPTVLPGCLAAWLPVAPGWLLDHRTWLACQLLATPQVADHRSSRIRCPVKLITD